MNIGAGYSISGANSSNTLPCQFTLLDVDNKESKSRNQALTKDENKKATSGPKNGIKTNDRVYNTTTSRG